MPDNKDVADNARNPADCDPVSPDAPTNVASSAEAVNTGAPTAAPADAATGQSPDSAAADDERDAADRRANCQKLFEIIRSCAAPTILTKKWDFLGEQDNLLRIDMPPGEFVEVLAQDYPVESLTELGLLERVEDELRLPSCLDDDTQLYVKIDDDKQTLAFFTGNEFLFPMTRTALDYALERIPPDSTHEPVTLFVLASQDAVEVMQRLGLRAVSSENLEALGRHDVQRLFCVDERNDFGWRYYLLLVDFDVARLDNQPTAPIGEVIKRLADAADVYSIDPARRFGVCRPTGYEFHLLERAIAFEDSAQICQLFEKWSATAKSVRINSWRTHFDTAAASYSVARAALSRALENPNEIARRAEVIVALPAYRAAGKGAVVEKFYEAADRASDPFDQVDLMAAADYAETFLECDPLVRAGEAVLAGQIPLSARDLQVELFEQRQRCMVEFRRIRRDRKAKH